MDVYYNKDLDIYYTVSEWEQSKDVYEKCVETWIRSDDHKYIMLYDATSDLPVLEDFVFPPDTVLLGDISETNIGITSYFCGGSNQSDCLVVFRKDEFIQLCKDLNMIVDINKLSLAIKRYPEMKYLLERR